MRLDGREAPRADDGYGWIIGPLSPEPPTAATPAFLGAELHHGALTSGSADQLAALAARSAGAANACIQFAEGDELRLYGNWGDWAEITRLGSVVMRTGAPLVVSDASTDDRVPDEVGAYLGHPVHDRMGMVLGVCCAYDHRPREWTAAQVAAVAEAADVATLLIGEQLARYELEQQHRFLDAVLDSLHDGVSACDAAGRVVFVNERMRRLWGDSPVGDVRGLSDVSGTPLDRDELGLFRALRGERVRDVPISASQGRRTRHFLMDAQPIHGLDGRVVGAVQALQDVTRQRRAERFRSCELAVTTALAAAPTIEAAGPRVLEAVVTTLNWVHAELWTVDEQTIEAVARWSAPGWPSGIPVPERLAYGQGLAGRSWQVDKPLWIRDVGRPQSLISPDTSADRLHTALAIPVHDGAGTIGVLTVFADSIEDPEDELVALMSGIAAHLGQFVERRRVEDLKRQLTRSKDEYLALIGHELRTPLTSISAYTELLREADEVTLVKDGPRLIEVIDRNTSSLREIINELLELSALDAGHTEVRRTPMDLSAVVREVVQRARTALDGVPVEIDAELPAELIVPGDRARLRHIVENLLGSAVRFSPDGGHVMVTLRVAGRFAELAVSDAASDVPRAEREHLFTGHFRTARGNDRILPGSGLGLTLSRAVVDKHHGTIELTGDDSGTTVLVRLPIEDR
ncbi:sensor histidine kinase [Actinoplanes derwentensis]|uniref:Sensor-like histidine kinase SenX3 n=1 Tax=Actinoplanes derwentensis TaxID=113562 RepID=A0A1H2D9F8_9ACTN|nr:ATP-binding protein [Actinoplanes derwentensis]SDT79224.1 GAF domain-containing protein [Actinoplanes derwentensis]